MLLPVLRCDRRTGNVTNVKFNYWRLETLTAHCSAYLSHASGAAPAITTIDASSAQGDTVTIKINLQCLLLIWASEPERIES